MALRIELVLDDAVVDGVEEWWDAVELALHESSAPLPLLNSVDPYGEWIVPHGLLGNLAKECRTLMAESPANAASLLARLAALCEFALKSEGASLRFVGD